MESEELPRKYKKGQTIKVISSFRKEDEDIVGRVFKIHQVDDTDTAVPYLIFNNDSMRGVWMREQDLTPAEKTIRDIEIGDRIDIASTEHEVMERLTNTVYTKVVGSKFLYKWYTFDQLEDMKAEVERAITLI